ncbi:MAG: hypothetical protein ACRDTE_21440 [Pseudonocardiaceae bacterium]
MAEVLDLPAVGRDGARADVVTGKRLLDTAKARGLSSRRIAPGPDGPLECVRESAEWRDVIHLGGSPAVAMRGASGNPR